MLGKSLYLLGVFVKITLTGDFPGGPVVKAPRFYYRGHGSILGRETRIPRDEWHSQN